MGGLQSDLQSGLSTGAKPKKTVQSLLGEHSKLVNLDNLVSANATQGEIFVFPVLGTVE